MISCRRMSTVILALSLAAVVVLACRSAAEADEWHWRTLDQGDGALLVISNGEQGTDHFGLPLFSCKKSLYSVEVEGEAKEGLRLAMADLIRADEVPWIKVIPQTTPEDGTTLNLYANMLDGWRYKFTLRADHKAFDRFKQSGVIEFKLGETTVREEFKVGLEGVGKFFELFNGPRK